MPEQRRYSKQEAEAEAAEQIAREQYGCSTQDVWVSNRDIEDMPAGSQSDTRVHALDETTLAQQQNVLADLYEQEVSGQKKSPEYVEYFDPHVSLEDRVKIALDDLEVPAEKRKAIDAYLTQLRNEDEGTYKHSLRVGLIAQRIARYARVDERALLYAGLMHDIGKAGVPSETLKKTEGWTAEDSAKIEPHVMDGYKSLRNSFDFTAEVVLLHHRFQTRQYPQQLPEFLHPYSEGTRTLIKDYGRILALADVYDALHRINDYQGTKRALSGEEIRQQMLKMNPDRRDLLDQLYSAGILTTYEAGQPRAAANDNELYDQGWENEPAERTPAEVQRHVQIAATIEPISDKPGCTTRFEDVSRHLKIEDFIIAGINIGESFAKLAERIGQAGKQPELMYDLALEAQKKNVRNRRGGRINQGIIEELLPIVAAHVLYDRNRQLSADEVLVKATEIMQSTSPEDVANLRAMKEHAHKLVRYDRDVPDYPGVNNVLQYYEQDLKHSEGKPTSIAHNREFVDGFPTVKAIYDVIGSSPLPNLNSRVEEGFLVARKMHGPDVGAGFLADSVASALYLYLAHHPREQLL